MTCLEQHALGCLNDFQSCVLREQINHHAIVRRVQVEDQYERCMQVFGHVPQQGRASFEATSRCAYGNNGQVRFCVVIQQATVSKIFIRLPNSAAGLASVT
jgi:hypothetical protein